MRARALGCGPRGPARPWERRLSPGALAFLRGRDADGRLRELAAARTAARPVLGALAVALVGRSLFERLGYRSLGDYARERLGVEARTIREWARVWRALEALPLLRSAYLSGELGFSVLRLVVGLATPETEEACLASIRGRTLCAVAAIVRAVKEAALEGSPPPGEAGLSLPEDEEDDPERVAVRLPCSVREAELWIGALELARRMAGESLPVWRCAEWIAAEAASALGAPDAEDPLDPEDPTRCTSRAPDGGSAPSAQTARAGEVGLSPRAFPGVSWRSLGPPSALPGPMAALAHGLDACTAREVDRRLRTAIAFLQSVDLEIGRVLRQMVDRRLFGEIGFEGLERYAAERLDLSARTARRLVALSRAEHRAPAVATAFREGRIQAFQAHALARVATPATAERWVEQAGRWSYRRLEDEVELRWLAGIQAGARPGSYAPKAAVIAFHAPRGVAAFFLAMLARTGSLGELLAHAIATWVEAGSCFEDYADFERDGFRCTVPGCTARRNLQSHHLDFRSHGGADVPENRTTLCAQHHQRALHGAGGLRIRGRAPDRLVYELGSGPPERFASGDVRLAGGTPMS
jgi:hypothetical protein